MKPHLPLLLLSALIFSYSSAKAVAPSADSIDLTAGNGVSLEGTGVQTGSISGNGTLTIASGEIQISTSNSNKTNDYTGITEISSGAVLKFTGSDFTSNRELLQLGTSELNISGTLLFFGEGPDVWSGDYSIINKINLKDGAVIRNQDGHFSFTGGLDVAASATASMEISYGKNWNLRGIVSGSGILNLGSVNNTVYIESKVYTLSNAGNTFTGIYNLDSSNGGASLLSLVLDSENVAQDAHIKISGDATKTYLILKETDATIAGLSGNGQIKNGTVTAGGDGSFTQSSTTKTLTINQTNAGEDIFDGAIDNNVNLTKTGTGTFTLTNLTGYTGRLGIQSGTLSLKLGTGSYDLSGIQATGGALNLESGTFSINGGATGAISLAGTTLSANGSTILFDVLGTESDKLSFTGVLSGTWNLKFNFKDVQLGDSFAVMSTDSAANASSSLNALNAMFSSFYKGDFSASGNDIVFTLAGYADSLLQWNGGASGAWNTTDGSWKTNGSTGDVFDAGKSVLFGDVAGVSDVTVTLDSGGITAAGVLVESDTTNYTWTGGALMGAGSLTKSGMNVLTLSNSNSYSGGTDIQKGELRANAANALGTGAITLSGGTLVLGNASAISMTEGENTIAFNGGILKYGTGITTDISAKINAASTGDFIVDTNGNNVTWATSLTAFNYNKQGAGTLTLSAGTYGKNIAINGGTLAFATGDVSLNGLLSGVASSILSFDFAGAQTVTLSGDTSGFLGSVKANVESLVLVNGALMGLTNDQLELGAATKLKLVLNGDNNQNVNYGFTNPIESLAMQGGTHELTMAPGSTIKEFTQTGPTSDLTLKGTMTFETMKLGIQSGVLAGTLHVQGSVTTGSFQGATINNARYTLNLTTGGELIVTGNNSDTSNNRQNASMILAIKGYGEITDESHVTTFNMDGGNLSVENATMFFADDGHVTWNMSEGTAKVKGLDMTNFSGKKSKLFLTGGEIAIGSNGFTTSSESIIELGDGTLAAYETWANACTANMSLTDAVNGTKIRVDTGASIALSGIISDKAGIAGKLVKQGARVLTMSGANTYSGATLIEGGSLIVGAGQNSALGTGKVDVNGSILDMNGAALTNQLNLTGKSNLLNAGAYAGADRNVTLTDMMGNVSLGNMAGNKISSISTKISAPDNGTVIKDIGSAGVASTLTLGNSSLAVGLDNLFASDSGAYPGAAHAILQFSQAAGSNVALASGATLTLNLNDADLIAKMQELQAIGAQTYQLLITNGTLAMDMSSILFEGLGDLDFIGIQNGNVILSGDLAGVFTVRTSTTKTLTDNRALDSYNRVLVNGTLNLNLPGVTAQGDGLIITNLGGSSAGVINIAQNGGIGTPTVTLNTTDANMVYDGTINGVGATLYKKGAGTQVIGGDLNLGGGVLHVDEGKLALNGGGTAGNVILGGGDLSLGKTSTFGTITAAAGNISLLDGSILNLTGVGSALSGDALLSGKGILNLKNGSSLVVSDNAKIDGAALNLEGGGSLDLGSTTSTKVSSLGGNGILAMNQGSLLIEMGAGVTSVFTGTLQGAGILQKTGEGTQELVGGGNANYSLNAQGGALVIRGDAATHGATYNRLDIASGALATIGTIGTDETAPMTRLTLTGGGTVNSGGTLRFIYNTDLDDALTSGPLLTTEGILDIQSGSTIDVTTLDNNLKIPKDFTDDVLNLVIADATGNGSISFGDGVNLVTGGLFKLSFENTALKLDQNGDLVLTGTVRRDNLFNQAVTSANTAAAADLLWNNRYDVTGKSELGKLLASITNSVTSGDFAGANHDMAASIGSTVTSLHAAQKNDFYKQQMWIRNRVAQMGVNPDYVNEDMPYVNMWIQANSSYDKLNTSGDESGYKLTTWGGTVGCDVNTNEEWTFGGAFTASYGDLTANAADTGKGDFDTYYANLFARMQVGKWSHSLIVSGGWNDMSLNRHVSYTDGAYSTRGTTNGSSYGAMYEATYDVAIGKAGKSIFQPLFNASIQKSKVDSYSETGAGNAGLDVSGMDSTTGTVGVGARLMGMVGNSLFGREVLGELRVMAVQDLGDSRSTARVGFLNDPSYKNQVRGVKAGSTGAQIGGSLVVPIGSKSSSIYVDVNADLRSKATSINGNIGYRYSF